MNSLYALFSKWSLRASSARVELLLNSSSDIEEWGDVKKIEW